MDLKNDKGVDLALLEVATTHGRPRPTRFRRKILARVGIGIALSLFLLYDSSHSFQVAHKIKAWKHSCADASKSFDNYIKRVEDAFLSALSHFEIRNH